MDIKESNKNWLSKPPAGKRIQVEAYLAIIPGNLSSFKRNGLLRYRDIKEYKSKLNKDQNFMGNFNAIFYSDGLNPGNYIGIELNLIREKKLENVSSIG